MLVLAGCEEKYKPAAYKAAPRLDVRNSGSEESDIAISKLPDVTDWTSPEAIRATKKFPALVIRGGGYRGDAYRGDAYRGDAYRGYGKRGYSGMSRGYSGMARSYRGYGKSQSPTYRGYENNKPSSTYRGLRR